MGSGPSLHRATRPDEIGHIAKVLYHWRAIPGSTSMGVDEKGYTRTAALKAIGEHLERTGVDASVAEIKGVPAISGSAIATRKKPQSFPHHSHP